MTEFSPLESEIRRLIKSSGPMPVWRYMELCLVHPEHGYYVSRDPLGREGDFNPGSPTDPAGNPSAPMTATAEHGALIDVTLHRLD